MFRLIISLFFLGLFINPLQAALKGKVDLGPTYIDVDVLESGKTVDHLHMVGVKGDLTLLLYQGLYIKSGFILASDHGDLASGSVALGYYVPINESLRILPHGGVTCGYLRTKIDIEALGLHDLKERFRSVSPFVGLEVCYTFAKKWTITAIYQFAWSRTHTKIKPIVSSTGHSAGSNYSLGLEYSLNDHWSINAGVGYNESLSKEKHGLRAKGAKLGLGYYF